MSIETLLGRLSGVRTTGQGKYIACCPAHPDRSPSLSVAEKEDGHILIHCHAGCAPGDVLNAIELGLRDLFPERVGSKHSYKPHRIDARQVLASLDHESLVVAIVGADFLEQREIDEPTWNRLSEAVGRINAARAIAAPLRHRR